MRKLVLNGRQIALLLKVSNSSWCFYGSVENFLEENKELPEEETAELEIYDNDEFDDVIEMINQYLDDDSLSDSDLPSEKERIDLRELIENLINIQV